MKRISDLGESKSLKRPESSQCGLTANDDPNSMTTHDGWSEDLLHEGNLPVSLWSTQKTCCQGLELVDCGVFQKNSWQCSVPSIESIHPRMHYSIHNLSASSCPKSMDVML